MKCIGNVQRWYMFEHLWQSGFKKNCRLRQEIDNISIGKGKMACSWIIYAWTYVRQQLLDINISRDTLLLIASRSVVSELHILAFKSWRFDQHPGSLLYTLKLANVSSCKRANTKSTLFNLTRICLLPLFKQALIKLPRFSGGRVHALQSYFHQIFSQIFSFFWKVQYYRVFFYWYPP